MKYTVPGWIHWTVLCRGDDGKCCDNSNWYLDDVIEQDNYLSYKFCCINCDHEQLYDDKNGDIRTLKQMQDNLPNVKN